METKYEATTTYAFPQTPEVDDMNQILRGEISATESYQQVMEKLAHDPEAVRLQEFLDDHHNAVTYWKAQVDDKGALADQSSGSWGTAVEAIVGAAKLLGSTATLAALKEGEEHGLKMYERLLESSELTDRNKSYIRDFLIPNQCKHINSLKVMMKFH
jgi:hypothetical protein